MQFPCKCCHLIANNSNENIVEVNGYCAPGDCKSKNLIYVATCKLGNQPYTGSTVQWLSKRFNDHRDCYKGILQNEQNIDFWMDDSSLGLHLVHEHGLTDPQDFDKCMQSTY